MISGGAPVTDGVAVGQLIRTASARRPWPPVWVQPLDESAPRLCQPSPGTWAWTVASAGVPPPPGTAVAVTAASGRARPRRTV